jgi:hypothetical protein
VTQATLDLQPPGSHGKTPPDTRWATPTDRRDAARAAYRHSVAQGAPLSGAELGRRYGRSPQWGRQIAASVRAETQRRRPDGATTATDANGRRHVGATPEAGIDMAPPAPPAVYRVTTIAVAAVAAVAATVSFEHQRTLAAFAGEGWRAWLLPIAVDGLVLAASMTMLVHRRAGQPAGPLAWLALALGLGTSLAANVVAADPTIVDPAAIRRIVAAYPPLALALAWELLLQQRRPARPQRT